MSSEHAKKRQWRSPRDAPDGAMPNMEALLDQKLSQMEQKMQSKLDAMQSEVEVMKDRLSRVDELEERCKYLEEKCESMGRSLKVLAGRWEHSAPDIPDSHWIEQGFDDEYVDVAESFLDDMQRSVSRLKDGALDLDLAVSNDAQLIHDDALLPHWQNLADAIDLYCPSIDEVGGTLCVSDIQLAPKVLALLTPPLTAIKQFTEIKLYWNNFPRACDGVKFAVELITSSPNLEKFEWVGNPLHTIDDANCLVEAINSSPSIRSVRLENCSDDSSSNVGYQLLTSLLPGSTFEYIDLMENCIRTMGGTHISGYLATNPPLKELHLLHNELDDSDATLIAGALKHNTNLTNLTLNRNDITEVGCDALANAIFDGTSLNSAADSNHTCYICGVSSPGWHLRNVGGTEPRKNRGKKIYNLLSSRNEEETNVHHLNLEFDDDNSLKFVPVVLERVYYCAGGPKEVPPLSIFFELLRGWKMPCLYENGKVSYEVC